MHPHNQCTAFIASTKNNGPIKEDPSSFHQGSKKSLLSKNWILTISQTCTKDGGCFCQDQIMKDAYDRNFSLHFTYGSNMNEAQIRQRCQSPEVVGVARLPGFRLAFLGNSKQWDGAEETVVSSPGDEVWGIVYKLTHDDAQKLDAWQDVRIDGTGPYFHYPADVEAQDGTHYSVVFYRRDLKEDGHLPSTEFLNFIIESAQKRGLPTDYIEKLRQMPSRPASYPVPKRVPFHRFESSDCGCSECEAE